MMGSTDGMIGEGEGRGHTKGKHFSVPAGSRVLKSTESALHCV